MTKFAATLIVLVALVASACAPKRFALPTGQGAPVADFRAPFDQASGACRAVRSVRTTIRLSGRAGGQRVRGTLVAGLERPDSLRLEGVAPFGPPAFILAARAGSATLLLPRDNRVLTGVSAADVLEALAGVRLDAPSLRAMLVGCVAVAAQPSSARGFNGGWIAVDVGNGATAYLREQQGGWRIVAGTVTGLEVAYEAFENGLPRQMVIQSTAGAPVAVNLSLDLSDTATNITLKAAAFEVDVPSDAVPITLEQLREAGPLGGESHTPPSSKPEA